MSRENIVISPSGNLYGSENVLIDFLNGSDNTYVIYAPKNSVLLQKLGKDGFKVSAFSNLKVLYLKVFLIMLFSKRSLYLNESGHISYVSFLARLLPFRTFVVSIRLLEDCNDKLKNLSKNMTLIPVSNYLNHHINTNVNSIVVYDSYRMTQSKEAIVRTQTELLTIGIVGRVSFTKGLDDLILIINKLSAEDKKHIQFDFYGTYDENDTWFISFIKTLNAIEGLNYKLNGFASQYEIYSTCNLLLHLNKVEALGRIIFECVDYNIPFLCYDEGGSGELANTLGLSILTSKDLNDMAHKIKSFIALGKVENYDYTNAKEIIANQFNPAIYSKKIEQYLV